MLIVEKPQDLLELAPRDLGQSAWKSISQERITSFAENSDSVHWSHTDPMRAAAESPFGTTIAQGFLVLSLIIGMLDEVLLIKSCSNWLNYGLDRLRFTAPVLAGARVRMQAKLETAAALDNGAVRLQFNVTMEIADSDRPALVTDFIAIAYP